MRFPFFLALVVFARREVLIFRIDSSEPSEVMFVSQKQTQFLDYPSAPTLSLAVTGAFCAAALEDGSLNVYSLTGRRCVAIDIIPGQAL